MPLRRRDSWRKEAIALRSIVLCMVETRACDNRKMRRQIGRSMLHTAPLFWRITNSRVSNEPSNICKNIHQKSRPCRAVGYIGPTIPSLALGTWIACLHLCAAYETIFFMGEKGSWDIQKKQSAEIRNYSMPGLL